MTHFVLVLTACLSYACFALSAGLLVYFLRHTRHPLGRAVTFMLFGEAVSMAVVAAFATLELTGALPDFPVLASTAIRWIALSVTAVSSIHLTIQTRKVLSDC